MVQSDTRDVLRYLEGILFMSDWNMCDALSEGNINTANITVIFQCVPVSILLIRAFSLIPA